MDEDSTWVFNAPQHYCDLPSAFQNDDSELADQYFFAKTDDTLYYEPTSDISLEETWVAEDPPKTEEQFPVIRRRSRSVGSKPQLFKKPEIPKNARKSVLKTSQTTKPVDDPDHYFFEGLRVYNPTKASHEALKVTKPIPFNLTMPKKKLVRSNSQSMAEGVRLFEKKTPERFHTSRHGEVFRPERVELHCTEAHTPKLTTFKRHRPVHAVSREVREQREVEEMKKNQFKAQPIGMKVFNAPSLPMRKETKVTKIAPFRLTESFKKENVPPATHDSSDYHFHAKPAPKFEVPHQVAKPLRVTVPRTPKFSDAGKAALHSWRRPRSRSNGSVASVVSNTSSGSITSTSTANDRLKNTVIAPFSFELRDKGLMQRREVQIKKVMDEERKLREFHAKPCPNFSNQRSMPERASVVATRIVPFHLSCDTLGVNKKEKFIHQIHEERMSQMKATQFKAQPAKVLTQEPFKVKLDHNKQLTEVHGFNLSTEKRAEERKTYDEYLKRREEEIELAKREFEQLRIEKEEEETARIRQETDFVANPIRTFKPVEIKRIEDDFTVPKTPKFMKH